MPIGGRWLALMLLVGCSGSTDKPSGIGQGQTPPHSVMDALQQPTRLGVTPVPISADSPEVKGARAILRRVVQDHARDPDNPWAIAHALLALGPHLTLSNGANGVEHVFEAYGEERSVGRSSFIGFPVKRGEIRVEPHRDLILKALTEAGVSPDRTVKVAGKERKVSELYQHSLSSTWVNGSETSFKDWDDAPWTIQALSTWAPDELAWTAGGHSMTMDQLVSAGVQALRKETAFLHVALDQGSTVQKRKQHIFRYTCGGAHMLQGISYAVARGFGTEADRRAIQEEIPVMFYRYKMELTELDAFIKTRPDYRHLLLAQRLKFLGHFLETTHKFAALGLFTPNESQQQTMKECAGQLIATVAVLEDTKILGHLNGVRQLDEQLYLDFVGDSAHALRGLDLATGTATIRY